LRFPCAANRRKPLRPRQAQAHPGRDGDSDFGTEGQELGFRADVPAAGFPKIGVVIQVPPDGNRRQVTGGIGSAILRFREVRSTLSAFCGSSVPNWKIQDSLAERAG
jgi:hypothetical protein